MSGTPLYAGFDLGTTNSAAAVFDGREVQVMRNAAGAALTPSVVRVDRRGRVSVGHKAARHAGRDPGNVQREFKRLMGTAQALSFADSDRAWLPEELAAQILASLRQDVEDVVGVSPGRAVISVPALFELPQSKATARAAELAGFDQIELLQEPIASALAAGWRDDDAGSWLVYDLGGGTFDASLLETRDGLLRVVGHDGDNFLGGRDFDHAIADWAIAELARDGRTIDRSNPEHAPALAALRTAAETAKIELSRADRAELLVEDPVEVDLELDRETFERICAPLVSRTVAVCRRLLQSHGLRPDQLSRVVLVGGPSVTPLIRREIEAALGAEIATGFDPMTLVAQGAALYAATVGLDGRPADRQRRSDRQKVFCQYPPVSADLEPHVIGRFDTGSAPAPASVELLRLDPDGATTWQSGPAPVDEQDAFVISVVLEPRAANRFRILARAEGGETVATEPGEITIIQGLTIGDPPLSRSIGVALANNLVHTYFERGTALPARRTFTHHTVETVAAGSVESVISVPIVQGEFNEAHLCRLVGSLSISGRDLDATISSGTPVEMTITVDRGGKMSATARIDGASGVLQFEGVAQLVVPEATCESLDRNLGAARARIADALSEAFAGGDPQMLQRLQAVDEQLGRAEPLIEALAGGDTDAGQRAARIILDADADLSELDAERKWPELEADATDAYAWAAEWVGEHGRDSEQRMFDKAGTALDQALARRSVSDVNRQLRVITRIGAVCFRRDPESWSISFSHLASRVAETTDLPRAKKLEAEGKAAMAARDSAKLRAVVEQLRDLLPADPVARRMSYESGVQ
jgi:molecular chaperone DnaK